MQRINETFLLNSLSLTRRIEQQAASIVLVRNPLHPAHEFNSFNRIFFLFGFFFFFAFFSCVEMRFINKEEETTHETCKERSKTEAFYFSLATRLTFCYFTLLNNASGRQNVRGEIARRVFFIIALRKIIIMHCV